MVNNKKKQRDNKVLNDAIADLKNGDAVIIRCPKCKEQTFVGVAQAYTSDDKPYPIGNCCCCDMNLNALDTEHDIELMMEFRNMYWDKWVSFCLEQKSEPVMDGN